MPGAGAHISDYMKKKGHTLPGQPRSDKGKKHIILKPRPKGMKYKADRKPRSDKGKKHKRKMLP